MPRKLISQYHPALYFLCVWFYRIKRVLVWKLDGNRYSHTRTNNVLPYRVKKHDSVLIRKLGSSDPRLQQNKIVNLKIAAERLNGLVIGPGERFSFCKQVGLPTKRKGYLPGMELSNGEAREGIGGGLCQMSNLIHWMVLHSPLTVVERRHHSFDPFPDDGRVLPFGSGAAVVYNYVDFQFENQTKDTYQILVHLTDKHLVGELRCNTNLPITYFVYQDKHQFLKIQDKFFRRNEIWRRLHKKENGALLEKEMLFKNFAEVKYTPEDFEVDSTV